MSDWLPSLNALRAFEATARHLSYPRAAAELAVTPGAVKQLVAKLETSVGAPLVRRKGRRLELTPQGIAALPDISAAMAFMQDGVRKMRSAQRDQRLLVSVEASLSTAWLVPRLDRFRARHPQVTVLVESTQDVADLLRGDMDVGLRYGVARDDRLLSHRLFDDQVFPACSPALGESLTQPPTLSQLAEMNLIHWDIAHQPWARQTVRWFTWDAWLAREGLGHLSTAQGLHFNEYGQAVQAAIAGQGVVLASWPILRSAFQAGLLVAPFAERQTTDIGYEICTSPSAAARPEVAAFVDWVLTEAKTEPAANPR